MRHGLAVDQTSPDHLPEKQKATRGRPLATYMNDRQCTPCGTDGKTVVAGTQIRIEWAPLPLLVRRGNLEELQTNCDLTPCRRSG
jgi:hypothetical protein